MKIVRFVENGAARVGVLRDGMVFRAHGTPFATLDIGEAVGPLEDLRLLPPVEPTKIIGVGLNYARHVTEHDPNRQIPSEPVLFMKPTTALIPHGGTILLPPGDRIELEAELCVVISRQAYRVSEDAAPDYILGYTCGNDVSHRDFQRKDGQWVRAKGFDTFAPIGPAIETEIDPADLAITSRLNGQVRQQSRTAHMLFRPAFLVSFISNVMTLLPGDIIMTGTPEGVAALAPGDTIEVEIEGIGILRNDVAARDA